MCHLGMPKSSVVVVVTSTSRRRFDFLDVDESPSLTNDDYCSRQWANPTPTMKILRQWPSGNRFLLRSLDALMYRLVVGGWHIQPTEVSIPEQSAKSCPNPTKWNWTTTLASCKDVDHRQIGIGDPSRNRPVS